MSEHTKGKLEVSGKLPYIFATTSPPYRLSSETIISWGSETGGQDWPAIDKEIREANAEEIVLRWNAFEEGGLVEELRTACEESQKAIMLLYECNKEVEIALGSGIQLKKAEELLKAALAKS